MNDQDRNAPIREGCPDPETLAAYVDGRLTGSEKAEMEAHLASCEDCYAVFAETARSEAEERGPASGVAGRIGRGWIVLAVAAALVAAAVPLALKVRERYNLRPPMVAELVAAVGPERPFEPRLTGGFAFGPMAPRYRSAKPLSETDKWEILAAAAKIRKKDEESSTPETLDALGAANLVLGQYDEAVSNLEEATLEAPKNARYLTDLSAAYLVRAKEKDRADDYPKALEAAEKATEMDPKILEAWFNRALALESLNLKGEALHAWSDYLARDSKSPWGNEARRRLSRQVLPSDHSLLWFRDRSQLLRSAREGDSRTVASLVGAYTQETRETIERDALPSWATARLSGKADATLELNAASLLAESYAVVTGDMTYRDAARIISQSSTVDIHEIAKGIDEYRLGWVDYKSEAIPSALYHFERARLILTPRLTLVADLASLHVAACNYYLGRTVSANQQIDKLIVTATRANEVSIIGYALWLKGAIEDPEGQFNESLEAFRQSLENLEKIHALGDCADLRSIMAQVLNSLGDAGECWQQGRRALALAPTEVDAVRRQNLYAELSQICLANDEPRTALHVQLAALAAERMETPASQRAELRISLGRIHSLLGRPAEARSDLEGARRWVIQVGAEGMRRRLEGDLLAAGVDSGEFHNMQAAVKLLSESIDSFLKVNDAYPVPGLLLQRGRLLRALGQPTYAARDLEEGIELFERSIGRGGRRDITFFDRGARLFDEMIALQLDDSRNFDRALQYNERRKARSLLNALAADQGRPFPLVHSSAIRNALNPNERLLYLASLPEAVVSWVIAPNESRAAHSVTSVSRRDLGNLVRQVRQDCLGPRLHPFPGQAEARLYDIVIAPLRQHLPRGSTLIVVPDPVLGSLPFAAISNRSTHRFLCQDYPVVICPSGSYIADSRRSRVWKASSGTAMSLLAVGTTGATRAETRRLAALPYSDAEIRQVARLYKEPRVCLGNDATIRNVLDAFHHVDVIHFAGHAVSNPDYPAMSHLVLAVDSAGNSGDLYARDLPRHGGVRPQLVVLSSCSSAEGYLSAGEGALSLARSFLVMGIPNVVASLWSVDDENTSQLMMEFHRRFIQDGDAAVALQYAQTLALKGSSGEGAPTAGWAGFEVFGVNPRVTSKHGLGRYRLMKEG